MDETDRSKDRRASASQSRAYAMHWLRMSFDRQMQTCKSSRSSRAPGTRAPVLARLSSATRTQSSTSKRLTEAGYVDGQNGAIEYRWAEGQYARLPALATNLVGRQVNALAAGDGPSALAAKAATSTIPIVFISGGDVVQIGLVRSLDRPGGNVTGVNLIAGPLPAKQFG